MLNDQLVHVVAYVPARPASSHIAERAQVGMRNTVAALELSGCFLLFLTVPDKWPSTFEKAVHYIR